MAGSHRAGSSSLSRTSVSSTYSFTSNAVPPGSQDARVTRRRSHDAKEHFIRKIRHGSFSRAAAELHLTQPAVSMHVRQLEARLGLRLLDRVGKRAFPAHAGPRRVSRGARHRHSQADTGGLSGERCDA
jgi:hypothetical protein